MGEAVENLKQIRQRAGYTGDCGLQSNLATDQAACMSAVLYERQIELAYEGKRFDDLRRWMLFDGGTGKVEGAPASWTLTDGVVTLVLGLVLLHLTISVVKIWSSVLMINMVSEELLAILVVIPFC